MTFKDSPEGQTHYYNDGCGETKHNDSPTPPVEEREHDRNLCTASVKEPHYMHHMNCPWHYNPVSTRSTTKESVQQDDTGGRPDPTPIGNWEEELEEILPKYMNARSHVIMALKSLLQSQKEQHEKQLQAAEEIFFENGRTEATASIVSQIGDMRPILWNDDPEKHKRNIIVYETITTILNAIKGETKK